MNTGLSTLAALGLTLSIGCAPSGSGGRAAFTWSRSFGGPAWDEAAAAIPTSDGGYLFTGTTAATYDTRVADDFDQVDGEVWVVKLDSFGNPDWERTYGEALLSPGGNRIVYRYARRAPDGGYWVAGNESAADSPSGNPVADGGNLVVARLDDTGTLVWRQVYDSGPFLSYDFTGPTDTAHESVLDLAPAPDGGLFVAAWLSARVEKPFRHGVEVNAIWVLRLDADGNVIFDRDLVRDPDGVELDRVFPYRVGATIEARLCPDPMNGVLVTAFSSALPDTRLERLTSGGLRDWATTRVEGHVLDAIPVDQDGDGVPAEGFLVAGTDDPLGDKEGFLQRFDTMGNTTWTRNDSEVQCFDCVAQGEIVSIAGLEVRGYGAAGTRPDDGQSGFSRVGRVAFFSLDGSPENVLDPYLVAQAPGILFDFDRWRVLGIADQEAFVSELARSSAYLGANVLGSVPNADTAELLVDGGVLDLVDDHSAHETLLRHQAPDGSSVLEHAFPREGRFVERAHALVELEAEQPGSIGATYAVLGESSSFGSEPSGVWVLLLDANGEILRQRFLDGVDLGPYASGKRIGALTATGDGGLAFAVDIEGIMRLVRLDAAGEELWNSEALSPQHADSFAAFFGGEALGAAVETDDGGFLVAGSLYDPGGWAARVDADGAVLWRRTFVPSNQRTLELTSILDTANGFLLGGFYDEEPFALEIDGAGNLQRSMFYPLFGSASGLACRVAPAGDGGFLLATSWVQSEEPMGGAEDGAASTGRINIVLLHVGEDLVPSWYRVYGGLYDELLTGVEPVPEGGWLVAGRSDSLGERSEAWLLRLDFEGLITEGCNAYLEGGAWHGGSVPVPIVATDYLPDLDPEDLVPAVLTYLETDARPQFPPRSVVARQCQGFTPPGGEEEPPPPGDGTFLLTLIFDGGGQGSVNSSPEGIDCRETCSAMFPEGESVQLFPHPDDGFFFSHWEGCDEDLGAEGCIVDMTSDRTVTVSFE